MYIFTPRFGAGNDPSIPGAKNSVTANCTNGLVINTIFI